MHFDGHNGQIEVLDDRIVVSRKGVLGFLTQGLKGDKMIPFASITAVQFKTASAFFNGYIQFTVRGGNESRGGIASAGTDENSVMFRAGSQAEEFARLKAIVEAKISSGPARHVSAADEVEKFAALRDRRIITEEEFQQKKRTLLGLLSN
jgi:hypothetical protein